MYVHGQMDFDAEFNSLPPEEWSIVARIEQSSNGALLVENNGIQGVYKSVQGENPLWDFPLETLSLREMQAFLIDRTLGFNLIPPTTWVESDAMSPGIIQLFIPEAQYSDVRLISQDVESDMWVTVVKGEIDDEEIYLQHSLNDEIYKAAVFDVLINNSDRKAGHLMRDSNQKLWLIDHGVSFHKQDKLRTVLWGWIGEQLTEEIKQTLLDALQHRVWRESWLLSAEELSAFEKRAENLLRSGMPEPNPSWPSLPSPIF